MKKTVLLANAKALLSIGCVAAMSLVQGQQTVIYQQNFDGNNGNFTNTIVSQNTPVNGWLASSTAPQYADVYRHLWNFSNVTTGGNSDVMPISGRSLGMGFFNGNDPFVPNQYFATYAGEPPADQTFYTTRWAHVGISTEGYENITVEFKWRCVGELYEGIVYDYGTVNTSIDGGSTWLMDQTGGQGGTTDQQGSFSGGLYYGNANVKTATLTLPANRANQPNFRLAFRMVVDEGYGTGGGFIIDDIIVRGTPISTMAVANADKSKVDVYRDGGDFVVRSSSSAIKQVEVYDVGGRLVKNLITGSKEARIGADVLQSGIYILKARLDNGEELTRKIIK